MKSSKQIVFHLLMICLVGAASPQTLRADEKPQGGKQGDNHVQMPMPVDYDRSFSRVTVCPLSMFNFTSLMLNDVSCAAVHTAEQTPQLMQSWYSGYSDIR